MKKPPSRRLFVGRNSASRRCRATGNRDNSDRQSLRELCPSDSASPDTDVAIAKNILANPTLYKELIQKGTINLAGR